MNFYDAFNDDEPTVNGAGTHVDAVTISNSADSLVDIGRDSPYGLAALRDECDQVAATPVGGRDDRINQAWFRMGRLVAGGHLTMQTARDQLAAAARLTGQPERDIQRALRTTPSSGLAAGSKLPRQPATALPETPITYVDQEELQPTATDTIHTGGSVLDRLVEQETQRLRIRNLAHEKIAAEDAGQIILPDIHRLDQFLATPDDPLLYRIAALWPAGGRVVLSAPHKAGKTTTVGNTLRSLADNVLFLGQFKPTPAQRIILVDNELDQRMLRRWLRDQTIINTTNIELIPLRGKLSTFNIVDPPIRRKWADHIQPADVLIFDCLRPALDALGLSEDKDAGKFLEALDELTNETGISDTLVIHHMGHNGERSRGDSRILDWPDAVWKLVKEAPNDEDDDESDNHRIYFSAYGRDVDQAETLLEFDPTSRHLVAAGGTRADSRTDRLLSDILRYLRDNPKATQNAIERAVDGRAAAVRKAIRSGVERDLITIEEAGRSRFHTAGASAASQTGRTNGTHRRGGASRIPPLGDPDAPTPQPHQDPPMRPDAGRTQPDLNLDDLDDDQSSCNGCGQPTDDHTLDKNDGYCDNCSWRPRP